MTKPNLATATAIAIAGLLCAAAQAQDATKAPDNGTDPTKMSTSAAIQYEHIALRGGFGSGNLKLSYIVPLGEKRDYSLRLRVPVARADVLGNNGFGLGDVSLQVAHVFGLTKEHGFVAQGELLFDTAKRPELGSGKTVVKGTLIYALFLQGGHIFAPAAVQSVSIGGDGNRARVNGTVFDFYYVPKLADPKTFVTVDPALSFDWEAKKQFASLAVTVGRAVGPAFGGSAQVFMKPSVFFGGERPGNWGVEIGYKVIGF